MPKSKEEKRCPCGNAHLMAVYAKDDYDEWALPSRVVAVRDCIAAQDFLDTLDATSECVEVMSSRVKHFSAWIEKAQARGEQDEGSGGPDKS